VTNEESEVDALLTREVRWFQDGPIPDHVMDWFTSAVPYERDQRVDRYDLDAARRGVGVKLRDAGPLESKQRLLVEDGVDLAPGLVGHVEDWLKISKPFTHPSEVLAGRHVEVVKEIYIRRYRLPGTSADTAGGKVELVSIEVERVQAWSLSFETFGPPADRQDALASTITQFLDEFPLPDDFELDAGTSCGYPAWISRVGQSGDP
jgi:hypothetical protein